MAQHPLGELFAKRHIQRYLLRKMDPIGALSSPDVDLMQQGILHSLGFRFGLCKETLARPMDKMGPIRLVALVDNFGQRTAHTRLNATLESLYADEQKREVDRMVRLLNLSRTEALHVFRNRYEITENVLPYADSLTQLGATPAVGAAPALGFFRELPIGLIYPRPHIQRYLLRKLNPVGAMYTPLVPRFQLAMSAGLGLNVSIQPETLTRPWNSFGSIPLAVSMRDLSAKDVHLELNKQMEGAFIAEFNTAMDMLHYTLRWSKDDAIRIFRSRYEITEDVLPVETSVKTYQRYEISAGRVFKRGRPRKGSSMRILGEDLQAE